MSEIDELRKEVERLRAENEALKNSAFEFGVGFSTRVNEMRAREEWLIGHLAEGDAYEWRCPNVKDEPWPLATCDSCNAGSVESRKRCWRKAAEMATRENPGISGNFPENEGEMKPCPKCGSQVEMHQKPWNKKTPFFVACVNERCLTCGPEAESKEKAIEAWNKR